MKYFKIFTVIFIAFMLLLSNNTKAQMDCPLGFIELKKTIDVTVNGQTCPYDVWLCVRCDAGPYPIPFEVRLNCLGPVNSECTLDIALTVAAIKSTITDPSWINENITEECFAGWGPCQPFYPFTFKELNTNVPACWKKFNFIDENNEPHIRYVACEHLRCITIYKVCWDGTNFQKILWEGPYLFGTGTCEIYAVEPYEPPDPGPNQYSDCFYIQSECWL